MIELQDIYKTYVLGGEAVHALDGVTLTIRDREFVAIIGASGSGKSTLMNIVGCLDNADSGQYYIDGQNIMDLSEREIGIMRNRKIGFIFQQFNLIPKLDAYENVELPLIYQGIGAKERKERVKESLNKVGLSDRIHHRPNQLSGGQQQRTAIARALANHPSLILADEPTGALDSKNGSEVIALLQNSVKQLNQTLVLITHNIDLAREADRIIKIADGEIMEEA